MVQPSFVHIFAWVVMQWRTRWRPISSHSNLIPKAKHKYARRTDLSDWQILLIKLHSPGWSWYSTARQINHIINIVKWPSQSFLHCVIMPMSPEWMLSLKSYCLLGKWVIQLTLNSGPVYHDKVPPLPCIFYCVPYRDLFFVVSIVIVLINLCL